MVCIEFQIELDLPSYAGAWYAAMQQSVNEWDKVLTVHPDLCTYGFAKIELFHTEAQRRGDHYVYVYFFRAST